MESSERVEDVHDRQQLMLYLVACMRAYDARAWQEALANRRRYENLTVTNTSPKMLTHLTIGSP